MKSYQHHSELEQELGGTALPHPKKPTSTTNNAMRKFYWYRVSLDTDNYWQDIRGTIYRNDRARQSKRAARRERAFRPQQFPLPR